jgi:ABC-2 type transport system ATP-binding protein
MSSSSSKFTPAIAVRDLRRSFGALHAVDGVSFEIPRGQVAGFVGANGAGKTTTMRVLATLDSPTSGSAEILGLDVVNRPAEVRRRLGWMPDAFGTYEHMTVLEYLDFFARAYGYRGSERKARVAEIMAFTELEPLAQRLINGLSKGMGQRLCLGRALIHDPDVLILDEPAAGLDPKARVELKHLIRILAGEGKTIFISSHILTELGEMCDTLLFIDQGRIAHHGSTESLQRRGGARAVIHVALASDPGRLQEWAAVSPGVSFLEATKSGARLELDAEAPEDIARVLQRMVTAGLPVVEFRREERKLEDAFIEMMGPRGSPDFNGS